MDYSEKWGTSIEEAVKLALDDLGIAEEDAQVTVLEQPSKGFFGLGSKLAKVRVEKKAEEKEPEPAEEPAQADIKIADTKPQIEKKKEEVKEETPHVEIIKPEENLEPLTDHVAIDFLKEIMEKMNLTLDITARKGEHSIYLDIKGKDAGTIIGKRGQTLDAVQYLTSLVVNKDTDKYVRVVVDAENYRSKREKTLQQLADRLAGKVIKNKRSVRLEPMNPYERKVIHATLQSNSKVTTRSEGDEPYRRVIIELK